jgi:glycosyltransferase involved in cell wall biosynthesis
VIHPWSEAALSAVVPEADIAVIALDLDDPVARAKPENKLHLLWRFGIPVLTSHTPAYARVMASAGVDGTCATPQDWVVALSRLLDDESARADNALTGGRYLSRAQSREAVRRQWDALFSSLG